MKHITIYTQTKTCVISWIALFVPRGYMCGTRENIYRKTSKPKVRERDWLAGNTEQSEQVTIYICIYIYIYIYIYEYVYMCTCV